MLSRKQHAVIGAFLACAVYALAITVASTAIITCGSGCKTTGDPILVNAERSIQVAFDTTDSFVKLERENEALVKQNIPAIHDAAEDVRRTAPDVFRAAWRARDTYKQTRSVEDGQALNNAIAAAQAVAKEARDYLVMVQAKKAELHR